MTYGQLAIFKVNTEKSSIGFIQCFLHIAVGLDVSFLNLVSHTESDEPVFTYCMPLGFALEIQAKFTPNRKVSPIVGYRITTNFGNDFATLSNGTSQSYKADSLAVVTNTVFVGISFNC